MGRDDTPKRSGARDLERYAGLFARRTQTIDRGIEMTAHLLLQHVAEIRARHAKAHAADRHRRRGLGGDPAFQDAIDERRVGNGPCKRAHVIESSRQRHHTFDRHFSITRLQTDDAARRSRDAN